MIGDSKDAGRERPIGEGSFAGIGNGYVALVEALLHSFYPELGFRWTIWAYPGTSARLEGAHGDRCAGA